jgi:hypothetical protein
VLEPEKRESLGTPGEVRDPSLLRVQSQPESVQDRRHQLAGLFGLLAGGAQDHQVICVLHQHTVPLPAARPCLIERVQSDVRE